MTDISVYFAMQIETGNLDYKTVFLIQKYKEFQMNVNKILISHNKQNLIVPIV